MRRTANVVAVDPVEMLDGGGPAMLVRTDFDDVGESAFYVDRDAPVPTDGSIAGSPVTYGDVHAWFWIDGQSVMVHKRGSNFWADKPLGGDDEPVAATR